MNIEYRPISKSFDIDRLFQNNSQKLKIINKVTPLKKSYLKISKPETLANFNGQQFPQIVLKKVQMNFRITSRHESFSQSSKQKKKKMQQIKQLQYKQTKNPQKLFFLDQESESIEEQINTNDYLKQNQNFITLNLKTLTLNEQIEKNPMSLFKNKVVKQKFNQRFKTQQACQIKTSEISEDQSLVYSTLVRKRLNQNKFQIANTELRSILNSKQKTKKEKPVFKISTPKKKKQDNYNFKIKKLQ